ncbi:hypothetical protein [Deinococcus sp.]|uniref:hypothetical protein n=1 Tax=Deinococcus sp. TaxID=47478 RepID=UPI0025D27A8B|nr:hypothetical protein [Deinococcus sp.]
MPGAGGTLAACGGHFWAWPQPSRSFLAELGELRQQPRRPNVLHPASGLVFAVYQRPGELTLLLGGTNTSDSDSQLRTLPSGAQQVGADVLNLLGGLPRRAFSPSALGRAAALALPLSPEVLSISPDGDPIALIGSRRLHTRIVGEHLRLPLHPRVPPLRRATSHGQIYPHLLAWLRERWPELPSALEQA